MPPADRPRVVQSQLLPWEEVSSTREEEAPMPSSGRGQGRGQQTLPGFSSISGSPRGESGAEASQAPVTSPTLPQPAPSRARTLEAVKRWARLAQARAASRPGLCATAPGRRAGAPPLCHSSQLRSVCSSVTASMSLAASQTAPPLTTQRWALVLGGQRSRLWLSFFSPL